jgi:hypothetical protein
MAASKIRRAEQMITGFYLGGLEQKLRRARRLRRVFRR